MAEFVHINGIPEIQKALSELTAKLRKKSIIAALKHGAQSIVKAARGAAPVYSGKSKRNVIAGILKKNIGAFNSKRDNGKGGSFGVYIRVRTPLKVRRAEKGAKRVGQSALIKSYDPYYGNILQRGFYAVGSHGRIAGGKRRRAAVFASGEYRYIQPNQFIQDAYEKHRYLHFRYLC
jgi:hypothetical protein